MTLNVEYQELMARADELEAEIAGLPSTDPVAPSDVAVATKLHALFTFNTNAMRTYLATGTSEWQALADSLRTAASAYEEVDEDAAAAVDTVDTDTADTGTIVHAVTVEAADADIDGTVNGYTEAPVLDGWDDYQYVADAAWDIAQDDQGASMLVAADEWLAYKQQLLDATYRFRPFESWEGDSASAVESSFDDQREWLYEMADLCDTLATQASDFASAQSTAYLAHPSLDDVAKVEMWYKNGEYISGGFEYQFQLLQEQSEEALADYYTNANISAVQPSAAPSASSISASSVSDISDISDYISGIGDYSSSAATSDSGLSASDLLDEVSGLASELPTSGDSGASAAGDAALADTLTGAPSLSSVGSGLKPASVSFGGGVGGLGGGSLAPWQFGPDTDSAARSTPVRPASAGGVNPGVGGGAMGGRGGGGMMPMAPGAGRGQEAGKVKRPGQEEEALYVEERAHTVGVIGRRRKEATDMPAQVAEASGQTEALQSSVA